MSNWKSEKFNSSNVNEGQEYQDNDSIKTNDINAIVKGLVFATLNQIIALDNIGEINSTNSNIDNLEAGIYQISTLLYKGIQYSNSLMIRHIVASNVKHIDKILLVDNNNSIIIRDYTNGMITCNKYDYVKNEDLDNLKNSNGRNIYNYNAENEDATFGNISDILLLHGFDSHPLYNDKPLALLEDTIIRNGSITTEKLSEETQKYRIYSKKQKLIVYNYVEESEFESGTIKINDGITLENNTTFMRNVNYMPVNAGTTLYGWRYISQSIELYCYFYDKDYNFISYIKGKNAVVPNNAKHFRLVLVANNFGSNRKLCVNETLIANYVEPNPKYEIINIPNKFKDETINAFLPDTMYCANGTTIDIYNNQVCINANRYHFQWICDIGLNDERKFTVSGNNNNIGNHTLTLNIYNDLLEIVWSKTITLKIVEKLSNNININVIGDSMTAGGGQWLLEVANNLSQNKINFVGTIPVTFRENTFNVEGRNGYSASDYAYTSGKNNLGNPYFNPETSKFDFNYYINQTGINPNAVIIELGTNGISLDNTKNVNAFIEMTINIIQSINKPVYICNAIYRSNQAGICRQLNSQGYSLNPNAFKYEEDMKVFNLMTDLYEKLKNVPNVHFIPLALCHDSANNFGKQQVPLNSRSKEMINVPDDSVHPNKAGEDSATYGYDIVGYLQFADVIYSVISGTYNQ